MTLWTSHRTTAKRLVATDWKHSEGRKSRPCQASKDADENDDTPREAEETALTGNLQEAGGRTDWKNLQDLKDADEIDETLLEAEETQDGTQTETLEDALDDLLSVGP